MQHKHAIEVKYLGHVIAICCDWDEYKAKELIDAFCDGEEDPDQSEQEKAEDVAHTLRFIRLDNGNYLVLAH